MNGEECVWWMVGYISSRVEVIAGLKGDRGMCAKLRCNNKRAMDGTDARRPPWPLMMAVMLTFQLMTLVSPEPLIDVITCR